MLPRRTSDEQPLFHVRSQRTTVLTCTGSAELVAKEMMATGLVVDDGALVVDPDTLVLMAAQGVNPTAMLVGISRVIEDLLASGAVTWPEVKNVSG